MLIPLRLSAYLYRGILEDKMQLQLHMILATASQILGLKFGSEAGGSRIELKRVLNAWIEGGTGLVVNLSEGGMAIQTMVFLEPGQTLKFALPLEGIEAAVRGMAEVIWCDRSGRAGLHFKGLSEGDRFLLSLWLARNQDQVLSKTVLRELQGNRASALLNAEVNCLPYHLEQESS
jgi:hypothetical protein